LAGGKGGNVTSAGWKVTLCDPIWHVSSHGSETCSQTAISSYFTFLLTYTGHKTSCLVYCATLCIHFVFIIVQKVQERWYEKLHEWEKALNAYERQQEKSPDDTNFLYGRMRCLEALGEWLVSVLLWV